MLFFIFFSSFVAFTIIYIAIAIISRQTAIPVSPVIRVRNIGVLSSLAKAVSIAVSSVSIETSADARLIAFDAEKSGLL